jgi:hypothetical protein
VFVAVVDGVCVFVFIIIVVKLDDDDNESDEDEDVDDDDDDDIDEVGDEFKRLLLLLAIGVAMTAAATAAGVEAVFSGLDVSTFFSSRVVDVVLTFCLDDDDDDDRVVSDDETTIDAAPTNDVTAFDMFFLNLNLTNKNTEHNLMTCKFRIFEIQKVLNKIGHQIFSPGFNFFKKSGFSKFKVISLIKYFISLSSLGFSE